MRLRHRTAPEIPKAKEQMPLTETIQTDRKGRVWREMSDDKIVDFAKRFMQTNGITGKRELEKAFLGLHLALRRRELFGRIGFEAKARNWASKSDDEMVEFTERLMARAGITKRVELQKADPGLYDALRNRNLLDRIGFSGRKRYWSSVSNDEIVARANRFMSDRGIKGNRELEKADNGLYHILQKRKLLGKIRFEKRLRDWASRSDDEVVEFARKLMKERGMTGKVELKLADQGLYNVLCKRKLLDRIEFEEKKRKDRDWNAMSDDELADFAKKIVADNKITGTWGLQKVDAGLYQVLLRRKLLGRVFAPLEESRRKEAVQQVFDGLKEFGEDE